MTTHSFSKAFKEVPKTKGEICSQSEFIKNSFHMSCTF